MVSRCGFNIAVVHISSSVAETEQIAADLAATLAPGEVITLEGDLGAGKTQFVRGLVRALGGDPRQVSSPTYVLLHCYPSAGLTVYHLDAYRVSGADELESIGFSELLDQRGIVVVEWASRVTESLPRQLVSVRIETLSPTTRRITIDRQK